MARGDRHAITSQPISDVLAARWSPRSYVGDHEVGEAELVALLEAARWAPSSKNGQFRRFVVGRRGGEVFDRIVSTLKERNALWAPRAALLIMGIAVHRDAEGVVQEFAEYDLGQAVAHLTVQAQELGLSVRQIGGFHRDRASDLFGLEEPLEPIVVVAVGRPGGVEDLDDIFVARETAPRERLPLSQLVLAAD